MYVTAQTDFSAPQPFGLAPSAHLSQAFALKTGGHLYFEGDPVERLYAIESGVLRLTRLMEDGRRQIIAFGYPGDIIGFPSQGLHHTDCDALTATTLRSVSCRALEDPGYDPAAHAVLVAAALREISAMQDHFMMLGRKSAREKVASFIKVVAERTRNPAQPGAVTSLPMCRSDIADFLGLSTETVSRCFTALRKDRIISLPGLNGVAVLDEDALHQRAAGQPIGPRAAGAPASYPANPRPN